jgi:molecular chaperone GrpE
MNKNQKTNNNEDQMKTKKQHTEEAQKDKDYDCQNSPTNKKEKTSNVENVANQKDKPQKDDNCDCEKKNNNKTSSNFNDTETSLEQDYKHLQEELLQLKTELINEKLKFQADLENFKKRIEKEKITEIKYASMNLISDMLAPLEQLGQALEMPTNDEMLKKFLLGFQMINKQIKEVLEKDGIVEIKALGNKFDPKYHHAVEKISDETQPNGINVSVLQKGFLYKDKIIKPAMVKVNEWSENKNGKNK